MHGLMPICHEAPKGGYSRKASTYTSARLISTQRQAYRMKIVEMYRRDPQWVRAYWQFDGRPPSVDAFNRAHPRCMIDDE